MKILKTDVEIKDYIEKNIARFYKSKSLIPFLGAGFTRGCKARKPHFILLMEGKK